MADGRSKGRTSGRPDDPGVLDTGNATGTIDETLHDGRQCGAQSDGHGHRQNGFDCLLAHSAILSVETFAGNVPVHFKLDRYHGSTENRAQVPEIF